MTVFLAGSALGILQHLQADGSTEVFGSDLKGRVQQRKQFIVRCIQDGMAFGSRQGFVMEGFVRQGHVGHGILKKCDVAMICCAADMLNRRERFTNYQVK